MTTKTILITSGSGTFTVPSDFISLVSIESIGAGAGNPYAGSAVGLGGGAYAKSISTSGANLVAGGTAFYQVGVANNSPPISNS